MKALKILLIIFIVLIGGFAQNVQSQTKPVTTPQTFIDIVDTVYAVSYVNGSSTARDSTSGDHYVQQYKLDWNIPVDSSVNIVYKFKFDLSDSVWLTSTWQFYLHPTIADYSANISDSFFNKTMATYNTEGTFGSLFNVAIMVGQLDTTIVTKTYFSSDVDTVYFISKDRADTLIKMVFNHPGQSAGYSPDSTEQTKGQDL